MRTKKIRFVIIAALLLFVFLFLGGNQEANAAKIEYEANWLVHLDFVGNQVNADLTVQVWEFTKGEETAYLETTQDLNCQVRNGVEIDNNEATFSGGKGIVCFVPNRRQIIYNMTGGAFIPPNRCDLRKGAIAETDIVLDPNGSGQVRMNPVFTMPDLSLDAIMPPASTLLTLMHFRVDGQTADSQQFTASPVQNLFQAFLNQVNNPDGGDLAYHPLFFANGSLIPTATPDIDEELSLPLGNARLDIGFSPETQAALFGTMTSLDIDPGCFPTG